MHDDTVYLHHMVDAISTVGRYLDGVDVEEFLADSMLQDAVIRQIQITGEAAKRVQVETRDAHPDAPWRDYSRHACQARARLPEGGCGNGVDDGAG